MDPYELMIGGAQLTIRPREDGTYLVFRGETKLALLSPDITDEEDIVWDTADWMDAEYATTIGKAIEEHEKHNAYGLF